MHRNLIPALILLLVIVPPAWADGCKYMKDGRKVPEHEQRALIEWDQGVETLYVAALSDPTNEATLWIVPVRSAAKSIKAEPVDQFPAVVYYETLRNRAERQLREAIVLSGMLDSGGLCCPLFMGGCGGAAPPKTASEASRIERLGMIVTVVSAESRASLERYLDEQGVNRTAADLSSLDPYFSHSEYAFICGWVAKRTDPVRATALKMTFPSPTLWFPLMPTRAYSNSIQTVVYVRGFVKPAPGCDLPSLKCEYIFGDVREVGVGHSFDQELLPDRAHFHSAPYPTPLERLTRVTLTTDPQQWDRDLELLPGTTLAGSTALAVTGWLGFWGPLWSALLGTILGLLIPWMMVARSERSWFDWLAGALTGAAIVLTIWASAAVFAVWRSQRGSPSQPSRYLVLPALAILHFGIVFAVCNGLIRWIKMGT